MSELRPTIEPYDGRVLNHKWRWWKPWQPRIDPDLWICEHCGTLYCPWLGTGGLHEDKTCVSNPEILRQYPFRAGEVWDFKYPDA